jgi:hypothetical protein
MALDPPAVQATGFRHVERASGVDYRWILGPTATITLALGAPKHLKLIFTASNPIDDQDIVIILNGKDIAKFKTIPKDDRLLGFKKYEALLDAAAGTNELTLTFSRYNHRTPQETFAAVDQDPLAIMISHFEITELGPE